MVEIPQIPPYWPRIAGMHVEPNGDLGIVWLAVDDRSRVVWCHDAAVFRTEVFPVIVDSILNRGSWIPLAWRKDDEAFARKLENAKVNLVYEPVDDSPSLAEVASREIWLRIRGQRFKTDASVYLWQEEFKGFNRVEGMVPKEGYPLMAATRHAVEQLAYARAQQMPGSKKSNGRKAAIF